MAYRKKFRNVGIVGIGETKYSSHREDVNQPEMINEAVKNALDDAGLTIDDIECVRPTTMAPDHYEPVRLR